MGVLLRAHRSHHRRMKRPKKRRQRIDTLIDAVAWMRRDARKNGEWPRPDPKATRPPRPPRVTK